MYLKKWTHCSNNAISKEEGCGCVLKKRTHCSNNAISNEEGGGYVLKNGLIVQIMPFLMKRAVGMY